MFRILPLYTFIYLLFSSFFWIPFPILSTYSVLLTRIAWRGHTLFDIDIIVILCYYVVCMKVVRCTVAVFLFPSFPLLFPLPSSCPDALAGFRPLSW